MAAGVDRWQDYRLDEAVDVNAMSTGGYNVGKITAGEYLRYTVVVKEDGETHTTTTYSSMQSSNAEKACSAQRGRVPLLDPT